VEISGLVKAHSKRTLVKAAICLGQRWMFSGFFLHHSFDLVLMCASQLQVPSWPLALGRARPNAATPCKHSN
jgi:hypothetical protein